MEVPHLIYLGDYYKNKNIKIINLCLSSKKSDWKKSVKALKLLEEHYFFDEDQTNLIRSKLDIPGYPSYIIVDKQGNIVDKKAARPSDSEHLIKKLDSHLK